MTTTVSIRTLSLKRSMMIISGLVLAILALFTTTPPASAQQQRIVQVQSSGLEFLDAELDQVVTHPFQGDNTQLWVQTFMNDNIHYTLMQVSSGLFLTERSASCAILAPQLLEDNGTQLWQSIDFGGGFQIIKGKSSGLVLDDFQIDDCEVSLRPETGTNSQVWRF